MVAIMTRRFGPQHLGLAEEAVQDALMRAMQNWPFKGVPDEPERWLFRVALNCGLDALRRDNLGRDKLEAFTHVYDFAGQAIGAFNDIDDELAMMFMCCHPDLPYNARIALTLKVVGGLGVHEIAASFLTEPATIAQRLVRAKKQIRDQRLPLEIPNADDLPERMESLLDVLYLLFNEGYSAHGGEVLIKAELCYEAIRLTRLLLASSRTALPHVHALLALMLFQGARLSARTNAYGHLLLLDEQDRTLWDRPMIAAAFEHFEVSFAGPKTAYHVEAAIASVHAASANPATTDWTQLCAMYDELMSLKPSPITALNRAIAFGMAQGPDAGLKALDQLEGESQLASYHFLPAARGAYWLKAGNGANAAECFREALDKPCSLPERRFLERQLARCVSA